MKNKKSTIFLIIILNFIFTSQPLFSSVYDQKELSGNDSTTLKVVEGIIQLFKQKPGVVWPGYDLAEQPFIVYTPGKWVLLINYPHQIEDFTPYPANWPDLGTQAWIHFGSYQHLSGQLVFNFPIDTTKVVAVGIPEKIPEEMGQPEVLIFGYVVHEAFHQYQRMAFGEIPWEREQKYPILDLENTALACLEMRLLMDALKMMQSGNKEKCREYIEQFVAVRTYRWEQGDPFVAKYEQGLEINEGTAQYVQYKSTDLIRQVKYRSSLTGSENPLQIAFSSTSLTEYLLDDFNERITGLSVSPEDMMRNRVYPVGSTQGFLLDYFGINWKRKAQKAGSAFSYARIFREFLNMDETQFENLLEKAKNHYNYNEILKSTAGLIYKYSEGYKEALKIFEAHPGYRIEVDLIARNISRSRSSYGKRWTMDNGKIELCNSYNIYTLRNKDLLLQVSKTGVFENTDWDTKFKKVTFFTSEIENLTIDDQPVEPIKEKLYKFNTIQLTGKDLVLKYSLKGVLRISGNKFFLNLVQKPK